jgi:hypothetical protein
MRPSPKKINSNQPLLTTNFYIQDELNQQIDDRQSRKFLTVRKGLQRFDNE